jgi:hypothetical protein
MSLSQPVHKKAVRSTPQLGEIRKIKKSRLPKIPDTFDVRLAVANIEKAKPAWDKTEEYITQLVKFHNLAKEAPRATASQAVITDSERADKELEEVQKLILIVRDRCIHSLAHPEEYVKLSRLGQDELYLYWVTLSEFTIDGGCEYYALYKGYSRFFMVNSRKTLESASREFEYYSLLKAFCERFNFDSELDKKVFTLFLDGFDPVVIADFVGEGLPWVKKKLEQLKTIAEANKESFFTLSEIEQREIIEEYREEMGIGDLEEVFNMDNESL